jgi:hypothetical protein
METDSAARSGSDLDALIRSTATTSIRCSMATCSGSRRSWTGLYQNISASNQGWISAGSIRAGASAIDTGIVPNCKNDQASFRLRRWAAERRLVADPNESSPLTLRWREMDSNHRSPARKEPVFVAEGELRDRTGAAKKGCFLCGTDGSNPSPSSGESLSPVSSVAAGAKARRSPGV